MLNILFVVKKVCFLQPCVKCCQLFVNCFSRFANILEYLLVVLNIRYFVPTYLPCGLIAGPCQIARHEGFATENKLV